MHLSTVTFKSLLINEIGSQKSLNNSFGSRCSSRGETKNATVKGVKFEHYSSREVLRKSSTVLSLSSNTAYTTQKHSSHGLKIFKKKNHGIDFGKMSQRKKFIFEVNDNPSSATYSPRFSTIKEGRPFGK